MSKILSKSGDSLADVYDVEGSIAGIDQLQSQDVNLVHEMGATIFSERLTSRIVAIGSGSISQSSVWNIEETFPQITRILGLQVITTSTGVGRIDRCTVAIRTGDGFLAAENLEVPIWTWDSTETTVNCKVLVAGAVENRSVLISPVPLQLPSILTGEASPSPTQVLSFRGSTLAFGAGTVIAQAVVYGVFAEVEGVSSRGLPLPSW